MDKQTSEMDERIVYVEWIDSHALRPKPDGAWIDDETLAEFAREPETVMRSVGFSVGKTPPDEDGHFVLAAHRGENHSNGVIRIPMRCVRGWYYLSGDRPKE